MRILSLLLVFPLLLTTTFCTAQRDYEYLPNHAGNWKGSITIDERFTPFKITPDEKSVLLQKATTALALIKSFSDFVPPKGMEMSAYNGMRYLMDHEIIAWKKNTPLPLYLEVLMGDYIKYQGKILVFPDKETYTRISLFFNSPDKAFKGYELFSERLFDKQGIEYYFEPTVYKTFENCVIYNNFEMIFTRPGKQLWIPVTAAQYLDAMMDHFDKLVKNGYADNKLIYDDVKKERDSLSLEDLNKPAFFNNHFEKNLSQLSFEKTINSTAIVRYNPDYYDRSKPRTAIQLLVLELGFHSYIYDEPILEISLRNGNNEVQLYNFFSHFDFSQFQNLFD